MVEGSGNTPGARPVWPKPAGTEYYGWAGNPVHLVIFIMGEPKEPEGEFLESGL